MHKGHHAVASERSRKSLSGRRSSRESGCFLAAIALAVTGCLAPPDAVVIQSFTTGEFGQARLSLLESLPVQSNGSSQKPDRNYMLHRMRLAVLTMADGYPDAAQRYLEEVYEVLRTQGINQDKTVASVVINEDLKIWKGEPFEQALAFQYIAIQFAMQGSWDNVRAASSNALFYLRDFSTDADSTRIDTQQVVDRAAKAHEQKKGGDDFLETAYTPVESNFTLGYLMTGIANQQLGRIEEAHEQYAKAVATHAAAAPLVEQLKAGRYNTLLVVDFGRGPRKIATGPDNAIARFSPVVPSDELPLAVKTGEGIEKFPVVCDVNEMAQDHMWNNLEDMRLAKSHIGSALLTAAVATASYANANNSESAAYAALGMAIAGAIAKAGAHADTRYCEAMPQRIYIAPVMISSPNQSIELGVEGQPNTRFVMSVIDPTKPGAVTLKYIRLVSSAEAPEWATSGRVFYSNAHAQAADGTTLPYILGGNCVRKPSYEVLEEYQKNGFLTEMSLGELEDLYRFEEIRLDDDDAGGYPGLHVLEGGRSLAPPQPGTAGYARLFCQPRQPYRPKSREVRELMAQLQTGLDAETQK